MLSNHLDTPKSPITADSKGPYGLFEVLSLDESCLLHLANIPSQEKIPFPFHGPKMFWYEPLHRFQNLAAMPRPTWFPDRKMKRFDPEGRLFQYECNNLRYDLEGRYTFPR